MYLVNEKNRKGEMISEMRHKELEDKISSVKEHVGLSKREAELVPDIAKGLSNKKLSKKYYIAVNTIKNHKSNIYRKFDCHSAAELLSRIVDMDEEIEKK